MFRLHVTESPVDPKEVGRIYVAQFGPQGQALFQHIGPEENGFYEKIKVPLFKVSHNEKDKIRASILARAAAWKIA